MKLTVNITDYTNTISVNGDQNKHLDGGKRDFCSTCSVVRLKKCQPGWAILLIIKEKKSIISRLLTHFPLNDASLKKVDMLNIME